MTIDLKADEVRRHGTEPEVHEPVHEGASDERTAAAPEGSAPPHEADGGSEPHAQSEPAREAARPSAGALVAASLTGGAVVALAIVLLALAGMLSFGAREAPPDFSSDIAALRGEIETLRQVPADDGLAPLREQIAAMEQAIAEMRGQAEDVGSDQALQELQVRLAEVERLAGEASPVPSGDIDARLSELGSQIETLRQNAGAEAEAAASVARVEQEVSALTARFDQELAALSSRVEGLPDESRIAAVEVEIEALRGQAGTARALALSAAADALNAALAAGRPLAPELAALETLGADEAALAGLRPHAAAGVATLEEIRAGFEDQVAAGELTVPVADDAGTFDRLLQSARGLIHVRPAHPTEGEGPGAIVARMRGHLAAGDLAAVLDAWRTLPEPIRARSQGWADETAARAEADTLAARVKADALARMSGAG